MVKKIILEPFGGLANRMRVIASGLWVGAQTQREVKLIWNLGPELNCPFGELFESIPNLEIVQKKFSYRYFRTLKLENNFENTIRTCAKSLFSQPYFIIEDELIKNIQAAKVNIKKLVGSASKTLYFITCEEFGDNLDALKLFVPKPDIQNRIDEQCHYFNSKTIGIHIRRTDHEKAIKYSPTHLFIKHMIDDLEYDPEINFFLTTDDPETEQQFKSQFGSKILSTRKELSRNHPDGIKDALVDIYCLANTKKIYGSYWSSFSDLAAKINGIEVEKIMIDIQP